jgi:hypothetical protein
MEVYDPNKFNKKIKISKKGFNFFNEIKEKGNTEKKKLGDFNLINTAISLSFFLFFGNILIFKKEYFFFVWILYLFSTLPLLFYHIHKRENEDLSFIYLIFLILNVFCFSIYLTNFIFNLNLNNYLLFLFPISFLILLLFNFYFYKLFKTGKKSYFIYNLINLSEVLKLSFIFFFLTFLIKEDFTFPLYFSFFIIFLLSFFFFYSNRNLRNFLISLLFSYLLVFLIFKLSLIDISLLTSRVK